MSLDTVMDAFRSENKLNHCLMKDDDIIRDVAWAGRSSVAGDWTHVMDLVTNVSTELAEKE